MKPLIKWVGGKRKYIKKYIYSILPEYKTYYEPFLGSGALFFFLEPNKSFINDLNKDLINFYNIVKTKPKQLSDCINDYFYKYKTKEDFIEQRRIYNENYLKKIDRAALFFFLNKKCFNGIYRVNSSGKYNVPFGKNKTFYIPTYEEFLEASKLLKKATISSCDWKKSLNTSSKGDLVYLDPPYYLDDSSKFIGYTDPRFGIKEHQEMLEIILKLCYNGVNVIMSNSNSICFEKLLKQIFDGNISWNKKIIQTNRSINPNALNKSRFIETLYIFKGVQ